MEPATKIAAIVTVAPGAACSVNPEQTARDLGCARASVNEAEQTGAQKRFEIALSGADANLMAGSRIVS